MVTARTGLNAAAIPAASEVTITWRRVVVEVMGGTVTGTDSPGYSRLRNHPGNTASSTAGTRHSTPATIA